MHVRITLAATTAVVAARVIPATAHAGPAHSAPAAEDAAVTMPVRQALAELPVRDEDRTGYVRTAFRHWIDADKDGCNTRQEVSTDEALEAARQGVKGALTGGSWYSPYDDMYFDDASKLDIDHLVPLAEAWDSGFSAWTAERRRDYANDLGDARALIAVSAKSNRSKADQDPSTWLPPAQGYRCQYVTDWVADKTRWGLDIDPSEEAALSETLSRCPDVPVTVTKAP